MNSMSILASLIAAVPVMTEAPSSRETQELGFEPKRIQGMRNRMASLVSEGRLQGMVTLIERHGKIVSLDAFGTKGVGSTEQMRTDTIFQIMSMTKPITPV